MCEFSPVTVSSPRPLTVPTWKVVAETTRSFMWTSTIGPPCLDLTFCPCEQKLASGPETVIPSMEPDAAECK